MVRFGEHIRELRKAQGLTQRVFADILGIDVTYISKIENSRRDGPPSEQLIRRMATLLDVPADELLALAGQFDHRALQQVALETPEVCLLLRRLQARQFHPADIRQFLGTMYAHDPTKESV